ncbi:GTPase [Solibacillus sp. FSL R7-0668]
MALVGYINSGKSSTINKLMNEELAMVGAKPEET